ncbi:uncharacterized protein PV09_01348 [Verruconis gallopava]|uniref:RING-type domain-containing protein n=1 Tax=Verruconis gallopava TaxID=253628 RepID=A0A0D2APH6_9PEZI|nr:uncharacterized protein PV09_01348 [Verruconis gallopava]KIW08445.1 hypothetical protein PV09_01348 [Verruconis gallopava]
MSSSPRYQCENPLVATASLFLALHVHAVPFGTDGRAKGDAGEGGEGAGTCSICWNAFGSVAHPDERPEPAVRIDPCGHVFGRLCLERHFAYNAHEAKCPTCRADLYGVSRQARRAMLERRGRPAHEEYEWMRRRLAEPVETPHGGERLSWSEAGAAPLGRGRLGVGPSAGTRMRVEARHRSTLRGMRAHVLDPVDIAEGNSETWGEDIGARRESRKVTARGEGRTCGEEDEGEDEGRAGDENWYRTVMRFSSEAEMADEK